MTEPHLTRRQREDPLVIAWVRLQRWIEIHARTLAIVAGVVAVVALALLFWSRARAQSEARAAARIAEVSALYWRGQYDGVVRGADEIRQQFRGTNAAADANRLKADALFWQGEFKKAAESYEEYLKKADEESPIALGVRRNLAQAYESDQQFKTAAGIYQELAGSPGPRLLQAELWLAAGRAWRSAGDTTKALNAFRQVAREYGDTPFAANAEVAIGELRLADEP